MRLADYTKERERIRLGGPQKYREKLKAQNRLTARERIERLLDPGYVEDGIFANSSHPDLAADGVVTAVGAIDGRTVVVMANDSTVKAGSWGARTVEKIIRIQEKAQDLECPIFYLIDSAGARITDQVEMFPGRRGAGRIFYNQVRLSGKVPQICLLFGPSAAGGAYIPAFNDVVIMVEGHASMYLGSPRMAEMVIGEKVSLEDMGGARMHCTISGLGDVLVASDEEAIDAGRRYLQYFPQNFRQTPAAIAASLPTTTQWEDIIPESQNVPFDMFTVIERIIDGGSFYAIKALFAPEIITGLARLSGKVVGIVANQSKAKGGVLFVDSADKAARFVTLCDAFNIPLLFLADVPGFMIGTRVERMGIIRHGAKLIAAISEATVPKISVVVRKAYGAGLYAMAGPAFGTDATIALPSAQIAVMGPEAAVNAVYYNRIHELAEDERGGFIAARQKEYQKDIDIQRLASELVVDDIVDPQSLRDVLIQRFHFYRHKHREWSERRHPVNPV